MNILQYLFLLIQEIKTYKDPLCKMNFSNSQLDAFVRYLTCKELEIVLTIKVLSRL